MSAADTDVSEAELADMIVTVTMREEMPARIPLGTALIELRQLRRWWQALKRRNRALAAEIERAD